ncbi:WD40 repeat domain-containing protein [Desulfurobacterium sp.]
MIERLVRTVGHSSGVDRFSFTPDGKMVISACDSFTKCWDVEEGKLLWTVRNRFLFYDMDITPDGRLLLRADEILDFVDIKSGKSVDFMVGDFDFVEGVKVNPEGENFAVVAVKKIFSEQGIEFPGRLQLRDLNTKEILWEREVESGGCAVFAPDGKEIIYGVDVTVKVFDVETGEEVKSFEICEDSRCSIFSSGVSPDGKFFLCGVIFYRTERRKVLERQKKIYLVNVKTGEILKHFDDSLSFAFAPDGKTVAIGKVGEIALVDLGTLREIKRLKSTLPYRKGRRVYEKIYSLSFSPDGKYLAAGSLGIELWDLDKEKVLWKIGPAESGKFLFCSGDFFVVVTDTRIFRYDFKEKNLKEIAETEGFVESAAFDEKTGLLVCGTEDKKVVVVDVNKEQVIRQILCPAFVGSLAFSKDKTTIAAGCFGTVVLMDTKTWETFEIPTGDFCPSAIAFRGKSPLICYFYESSEFVLENLVEREIVKNFGEKVSGFAFSDDGRFVAVAKIAGDVEVVNTETGLTEFNLKVKKPSVLSFLGNHILACGTFDGDVSIFDLKSGDIILKIPAHLGFVNSIAFSKDNNYMISAGEDGSVVKYDLSF